MGEASDSFTLELNPENMSPVCFKFINIFKNFIRSTKITPNKSSKFVLGSVLFLL